MGMVKVGIANVGEKHFSIEEVSKWTLSDIIYMGDTIFFKHDNVYYSMNIMDYRKIFK